MGHDPSSYHYNTEISGLGTSALQLGFSRLNVLFLFESDTVNPVFARVRDVVRVVRVHFAYVS